MKVVTFLCLIFLAKCSLGYPQGEAMSLVATTEENPKEKTNEDKVEEEPKVPKIYEMYIRSEITNRFANTTIRTRVKNLGKKSQEATFSVVLPDSAYITGFIMEIGGKNYTAYVKEKEKAKREYEEAVASGTGAAHVAVTARDSNRFTVSVNVEPESKAIFYLTYEELLKRKQQYELVLNIHPKQPVPNMRVEVVINETKPLKFVRAPSIRSGNDIRSVDGDLDPRATIEKTDQKSALVVFSPSEERQKELANTLGTKEEEGLSGQFVLQYDVERDSTGGEILVKDGYFVHFFAPENLKPLPKHVIFILDTSGSMYGMRIQQLKKAMGTILAELKENEDYFHLVEFNSMVKVWNIGDNSKNVVIQNDFKNLSITENNSFPEAFPVTQNTIQEANNTVQDFDANGGTNIYFALRIGIYLAKNFQEKKKESVIQPLIIFLTDGEPTVGPTDPKKIEADISDWNEDIPLFSLSFGEGADKEFLQKLSLKNNGFSRHIYEAADAALQLQDFYKQISSPLLSDVKFKYTEDAKKITRTHFPNYFGGSEIVISGFLEEDEAALNVTSVSCFGIEGPKIFRPIRETPTGELERLWAYITVQQKLEQSETSENRSEIEKEIIDLALKYNFVTPLTSMVVVKPDETKDVNAEAADKSDGEDNYEALYYKSAMPLGLYQDLNGNLGFRFDQPIPDIEFDVDSYNSQLSATTIYHTTMYHTTEKYVPTPKYTENIFEIYSWLYDIYDMTNDTITLPNGVYNLGINTTITEIKTCTNSLNNTSGQCVLLTNCKKMNSSITNVDTYMQHFCIVQKFAGICCPQ